VAFLVILEILDRQVLLAFLDSLETLDQREQVELLVFPVPQQHLASADTRERLAL
jgi:hypothetical protein